MAENPKPHQDRVSPPDASADEDALKEYGRQLAMDSLLLELRPTERGRKLIPLSNRAWARRAWISASAASLAGLAGFAIWKFRRGETLGNATPAPLDPRWILQAASDAEFQVLSPNHVRLLRGELRFTSREPAKLLVETAHAKATASGTDFLIGYHDQSTDKTNQKDKMRLNTITRLLVIAGSVTLATSKGAETANPNEAVIAKPGESPEKILVQANSKFAFDCYAALAGADRDANLFFSPYSISSALLMIAEGARGETAQELGSVLGFPEALRRAGDDAQSIPWEMGKARAGYSRLSALLGSDENLSQEQERLRKQESALMEQWERLKEKIATAKGGDHKVLFRLEDDERILVYNLNQVRKNIDTLTLRVANSVWGERTMQLLNTWQETVSGDYGAGAVEEADFVHNYDAERKRINAWVETQTEGHITNILPEGSLNPDTRLVLANAVYFKGDWTDPFPKGRTAEADFRLQSGDVVKVMLMKKDKDGAVGYAAFNGDGSPFETPKWNHGEEMPKYPGEDGFSIVELPYRGGDVSMVVIAPNHPSGLPALEGKLNNTNVSKWIATLKNRKTNIRLPRFKLESSYDLTETLAALGMPSAFAQGSADFSGISGSKEIFISSMAHKAFIEVTEDGTEAAAASGIMVPKSIEPFVPTFSADRPFIYLIRDQKSDTVLFLGRVINPAA